ncbi:MAG: NrfD/PsrC family molybdoenzyme membrane anchor subunit, partial [Pseudomonadota bacterium]
MAASLVYRELGGPSSRYWGLLALLAVPLALGAAAYFYIEHYGHIVTGMDNQIVWGMPHVFSMFLVVAATGVLNVAMAASVFGQTVYRPVAPLSALVSLALLAGGLALLMLDLGRSDRMIVATTNLNTQSVFALRVVLYDGFMASVGVYLWFLLAPRFNRYVKPIAIVAFVWQLLLITGTGLEFGFNFRAAYDSALYAPMFIAFSSAYGTAVLTLILLAVLKWEDRPVSDELMRRLKNLLGISIGASLFFAVLFLATKYELARSRDVARFFLFDGGVYTALLWLGQIAIGAVVPLALLLRSQVSRA